MKQKVCVSVSDKLFRNLVHKNIGSINFIILYSISMPVSCKHVQLKDKVKV